MWSTPLKSFGLVHILGILGILVMLQVGVVLGKKYSYEKYGEKVYKGLGFAGLAFLALDLFKQIFSLITNTWTASILPFQICSTITYILILLPLVKNKFVRKAFLNYIAFFIFTAGILYFVKPAALFNTPYIAISMQSILWHWLITVTGTFCMTSFGLNKKEEWKSFASGSIILVIFTLMAILFNSIANNANVVIDFFYINPINPTFYPILNLIFKPDPKPYPVYIIVFLLGITAVSAAFKGLAFAQSIIVKKIASKKQK